MKSNTLPGLVMALCSAVSCSGAAAAFSFDFEWGDIPRCTSGDPNRVSNPIFSLTDVPAGTTVIEFEMDDEDAPNYYHGGGSVQYTGLATVEPGAFEYKSPCPPRGRHTYVWTGRAKDASGKVLATARASKKYP